MTLLSLIPEDAKTISVIGMVKNAGKTVTLNRLISEAGQHGRTLGLTSIGRDGELMDIVTGTEKPGIDVMPGTLVATTDVCLGRSDARVEILENTREKTPVGQVLIVRVREKGRIELAGPDTSRGIQEACQKMVSFGADQVLVDGALNRKSSASPAITDASILSTGAALDRNLHRVVEETAHQVHLLNLPQWRGFNRTAAEGIAQMDDWLPEGCAAGLVSKEGRVRALRMATALNGGKEIGRAISRDDLAVMIRGSLTSRTIREIMSTTDFLSQTTLVIEDATRLFVNQRDWQIWKKMGLRVQVLRRICLLFITINPWSPGGWRFDSQTFLKEMKRKVDPCLVVDVMGREDSE